MTNRTPDYFKLFTDHIIVLNPTTMEWELVPKGNTNTDTTSKIDLDKPLSLTNLVQDYIKNNYRVVLTGAGGCGKNYAKDLLEENGYVYGPSYTSRDIRPNEVDGSDYHFITKSKFESMIENNEFYEYVEFGGQYYGSTNAQFLEDCNLFIMTAGGINQIKDIDRERTIVIFFDIDPEILMSRMSGGRGDSDQKVINRMKEDRKEFNNWTDFDLRITNDQFSLKSLIYNLENTILKQI